MPKLGGGHVWLGVLRPPHPPHLRLVLLPLFCFRRLKSHSSAACALTLALPAGMVVGPSWGASLPPPAMPAALRLLCGVVVPAAMLCAEPLPRISFPSGEYGTGKGWDGWGGGHTTSAWESVHPQG